MGLLSFLTGGLEPIGKLVDNLHTSDEERLALKNELAALEFGLSRQLLAYEEQSMRARADIIIAEAKGESWIQRNWRPLMMLNFGFILMWNWAIHPIAGTFVELPVLTLPDLPQGLWTTIQIGLGSYIVGRSGEKIVKKWPPKD